MTRRIIIGTAGLAAIVAIIAALWFPRAARQVSAIDPAELPAPCRNATFEGAAYVVCEIDTASYDLGVFHGDADGEPFGSLDAFDAWAARPRGTEFSATPDPTATPVVVAMNAGMYHENMSPVGLLVVDGVQVSALETRDGEGNFFLKPNGVLSVGGDGAVSLLETGAYAAAGLQPRFATQSGPMLVIAGKIHPRFEQNGASRFVRNGVGLRNGHSLVLAISLDEVSLGSFARLFRDRLNCPDALFFDGAISSLSNGRRTLLGGAHPVGPIIAVSAKRS